MWTDTGLKDMYKSVLSVFCFQLQIELETSLGRGSKKKVVILLQPLSIYLPTPIIVKKGWFCSKCPPSLAGTL